MERGKLGRGNDGEQQQRFLNIVTGGGTLPGLILTNYGTVTWTNTPLYAGEGTQIYNYGLWDLQSDNGIIGEYYGGPAMVFDNIGTFIKSGNTGTSTLEGGTLFNNTGTVNVQQGTLNIADGAGTNSGGGAFTPSSGATLEFEAAAILLPMALHSPPAAR